MFGGERVQEMYAEYQRTLKEVSHQLSIPPSSKDYVPHPDRQQLASAAADLRYIISWLETGYPPKGREERLSQEQREISYDPQDYRFIAAVRSRQANEIPQEERDRLADILSDRLTEREREVFVMVRGGLCTQYAVAKQLGIKRASVETMLKRAETKLKDVRQRQPGKDTYVQRSLFG